MRAILVAALVAVASASLAETQDWTFKGNLSDLEKSGEFTYRFSSLTASPIAGFATWVSASIKAHSSSSGDTGADINTIVGQMYKGGILQPPWNWLAFVKAAYTGTPAGGDFAATAGALAMAYLSLNEVDPNGKVVTENSLKHGWSLSNVKPWGTDLSVVNMTATINSAEVVFTYVTSNILGQLNYANAIVSPKSLECIMEINGWAYQNPLNHLEMKIGIATIDATVKGNAIITKKGKADVYFTLSDTSIVNGTVHDVEVTKYIEGSFESPTLDIWVKALVGTNYKTRITTIKFAAGGKTIIYDPALAQGTTIVYGAASSLVPFSMLLLVALALLLFLL